MIQLRLAPLTRLVSAASLGTAALFLTSMQTNTSTRRDGTTDVVRPPIDERAPEHVATATFALG